MTPSNFGDNWKLASSPEASPLSEATVNSKPVIVPDVEAIKAEKLKTKDFDSHVVGRLAVKIVPAS